MSTLPKSRVERVQFFENHVAIWKANAEALGLAIGPVDELKTATTSARTDYNAMESARNASRAATEVFNNAEEKMVDQGMKLIDAIHLKVKQTGNTNLYALAQIPAPKTPGPVPAPGKPSNLTCQLGDGGALALSWRCRNPRNSSGTVYEIRRQDESGASVHVATVGQRKFIDRTIPAGSSRLTYTLTAIRSTKRGPEAEFQVKFGSENAATLREEADGPEREAA